MTTNDSVRVVTPSRHQQGQQGLTYFEGVSAETAGATGLCLHRLVVPPGGRAKAHLHAHHESAIYVLTGSVRVFWGDGLEHSADTVAGDFVYIPAGCRTCRSTSARTPRPPRWWPAPTRTSRRASCCAPTSTRSRST